MKNLDRLYVELDHMENAEYIITRTAKAIADDIGDAAASEPDKQMQRRTVLSELAHRVRLAIATGHRR